jgi:hypothetical protein
MTTSVSDNSESMPTTVSDGGMTIDGSPSTDYPGYYTPAASPSESLTPVASDPTMPDSGYQAPSPDATAAAPAVCYTTAPIDLCPSNNGLIPQGTECDLSTPPTCSGHDIAHCAGIMF